MPIHRFILHNQDIRDASEPVFTAGQAGLLSGWGVFSTVRVVEGVLFAFERHWARMMRDARLLNVEMPGDCGAIIRSVRKLIEANQAPNCTLRIAISRNAGNGWEGAPIGRASDVVALTADLKNWGTGVNLTVQEKGRYSDGEFSGAKILAWAQNLAWAERAKQKGFDEVILLNERGEVAECTSANIFIAKGPQIFTPPLFSGCLAGITRELLLTEVRIPGVEVVEDTITRSGLALADEIFITSTTRDLLPVLTIDGVKVKNTGQVRGPLNAAFRRYLDGYVAERKLGVQTASL